jgi:hypothetical protein
MKRWRRWKPCLANRRGGPEIEWIDDELVFLQASVYILVSFVTSKKVRILLTLDYECCFYCEQKGAGIDWEEERPPNTESGEVRGASKSPRSGSLSTPCLKAASISRVRQGFLDLNGIAESLVEN